LILEGGRKPKQSVKVSVGHRKKKNTGGALPNEGGKKTINRKKVVGVCGPFGEKRCENTRKEAWGERGKPVKRKDKGGGRIWSKSGFIFQNNKGGGKEQRSRGKGQKP